MKISVIIPSKNGLRHLQDCLPSVIAATAKAPFDTEIIVVDDNSTDCTFKEIPPRFAHVKFIKNPKSGVCSARNFAVKNSSGDWLLFIDNDVFLEEDFFVKTARYLQDNIFCVANKFFLSKRGHFIVLNGFDEIYYEKESAELDFIYRGIKRGWKGIFMNIKLKQINFLPPKDYFPFIYKNITSNKLLCFMFMRKIFSFSFIKMRKIFLRLKEKRKIEKINSVIEDEEIYRSINND